MSRKNKKKLFIIILQLVLAIFFVALKGWTSGTSRILYQSYFADILIPFSFYFLLALNSDTFEYLNKWQNKALVVFALCTTSEILQYFGIFALARVFDPVDIAMYGLGVLLAAFVDKKIFSNEISFWKE